MVSAVGIFKQYPGGVTALNGVDLSIGRGEAFSLLGPNGAGKSSLIKIMTSLSRPSSGKVTIDGYDPSVSSCDVMRRIGVATQNLSLDQDETPEALLEFQGKLFGLGAASRTRADELISHFRLEGEAGKKVSTMSGGNQRRLHIALSLVHRPKILFLDEPTVGMDPESRAVFWESVGSLNRTEMTTIFLTTQYLDEAEKHTRTMALLIGGRIAWNGTVKRFRETVINATDSAGENPSSLEESYLRFITNYHAQEKTA